jgi:hypothetical protein
VSTEQRDNAAAHYAYAVPGLAGEDQKWGAVDFAAGWDGHAATMPDREAIEKVMRGAGLSDEPQQFDSSIHSWRCEHPDRYGKCSCFQELAAELLALLSKGAPNDRLGSIL